MIYSKCLSASLSEDELPKVIQMLKCFVNSVFKDIIPKDAVGTSNEVRMKEPSCSAQELQELCERKDVIAVKLLHILLLGEKSLKGVISGCCLFVLCLVLGFFFEGVICVV